MDYKQSLFRYKNFLRLQKQGISYREIGLMYGISGQAVYDRVKKGEPKKKAQSILDQGVYGRITGRDRARMLVRVRDNFTCQDCGGKRTFKEVSEHNKHIAGLKGRMKLFDVHHTHGQCGKNFKGYDSTDDISKMITLCHSCHYNRPEHKTKKYGNG